MPGSIYSSRVIHDLSLILLSELRDRRSTQARGLTAKILPNALAPMQFIPCPAGIFFLSFMVLP